VKGYWPAAWPAEDGGPRRLQCVPDGALDVGRDGLSASSRSVLGGTMAVQRERGELYLQGAVIGPDSTAWLERIDPETLEPLARVEGLPAGPWWPGGVLAHANGDLYLTQGRWCHRIAADLTVRASRELPRERPYNSLLALPDGSLAMKDMSSDDAAPSQLILLEPEQLEPLTTHDLPEGSIARISADGHTVAVVGMDHLFALRCSADGIEEVGRVQYRSLAGQTYGWDPVMDQAGSAWFLDNGAGTEAFSGSFVGQTSSTAPLHLVRAPWPPSTTAGDVELSDVCGDPGGIIANPPIIVEDSHVAIGYDSGHGVMTAWRWTDSGSMRRRWQRQQNHASHALVYPRSGEVVTMDYDVSRGMDQCVVLDVESGAERARVDTGSPIQSVLFPCPGWDRDLFLLTMTTLTRVRAV
jgi:hypothetical protein